MIHAPTKARETALTCMLGPRSGFGGTEAERLLLDMGGWRVMTIPDADIRYLFLWLEIGIGPRSSIDLWLFFVVWRAL